MFDQLAKAIWLEAQFQMDQALCDAIGLGLAYGSRKLWLTAKQVAEQDIRWATALYFRPKVTVQSDRLRLLVPGLI